jgi:hypothetical protein
MFWLCVLCVDLPAKALFDPGIFGEAGSMAGFASFAV